MKSNSATSIAPRLEPVLRRLRRRIRRVHSTRGALITAVAALAGLLALVALDCAFAPLPASAIATKYLSFSKSGPIPNRNDFG